MDAKTLARVRSFHRVVTQRVGALDDAFLARDRPLGAGARAVGDRRGRRRPPRRCAPGSTSTPAISAGCCGRWSATAWSPSGPATADRRVRTARLTPAGLAERAELDRRSRRRRRRVARPAQRGAAGAARRGDGARSSGCFLASTVEVAPADPRRPDARDWRPRRTSPSSAGGSPRASTRRGASPAVGRRLPRRPASCCSRRCTRSRSGAARSSSAPTAPRSEADVGGADAVRGARARAPAADRAGGGARPRGVGVVRLETHRALTEAIALYRSAGYREVAAFNDEPYAHHWFEKRLP